MIPRKQSATHERFVAAMDNIEHIVTKAEYLEKKTVAIELIKKMSVGKCSYAWSGGKDSIALQIVCKEANVHDCVLGMTNLEYPKFLQWITDHMPHGLTVLSNGWDLEWLAKNQHMIFPQTSRTASVWFKGVQHAAQDKYCKKTKTTTMFMGRRLIDGNYCGKGFYYKSKGITKVSPIADWSHETVLACLYYEGKATDLPPFYRWPRGYRCGTHSWPARQWCTSINDGWREVYGIDYTIVIEAASKIDSAKKFLDSI